MLNPPPDLILESERIKGAPHLSLSLSASTQHISVSGSNPCVLSVTIHYHAALQDRPITFRTNYIEQFDEKYALLIWPDGGNPEEGPRAIVQEDWCQAFSMAVLGVETLAVTDRHFTSLAPGESKTTTVTQIFENWTEDFELGMKYTYQYIGGEISWWDWGTFEDHKNESIGLFETSHSKRPRIVLPASNALEFTAVE
ncbi:hypothetical protein C8R47DRAFT_511183 [Mycena vitilis]|nr:hypothetical protein C8R47DRAFT_511183 [Mycena vitilis]